MAKLPRESFTTFEKWALGLWLVIIILAIAELIASIARLVAPAIDRFH